MIRSFFEKAVKGFVVFLGELQLYSFGLLAVAAAILLAYSAGKAITETVPNPVSVEIRESGVGVALTIYGNDRKKLAEQFKEYGGRVVPRYRLLHDSRDIGAVIECHVEQQKAWNISCTDDTVVNGFDGVYEKGEYLALAVKYYRDRRVEELKRK